MNFFGSLISALLFSLQISNVSAESIVAAERAIEQNAYDQALDELNPLAKKGDPQALYLLGTLYLDGRGVEQNTEQAQSYFSSAARQGHLDSVNALREIKNAVYKLEFDDLIAKAESGNVEAQNRVGEMYEYAQGVNREPNEALSWYKKAAETGYIPAVHNLARAYNFGIGTSVDFAQAEALFRQAADAGYAESMFFLGTLYATLNGSDKSADPDVLAYAWMQSAAERGSQTAEIIAGRFKMKLVGEKLNEAESLTEVFRGRFVTPFQ